MKTIIQYIANNLNKYLKQNTEKTQYRSFLQFSTENWYMSLDCDSTILGKTTIQVLIYGVLLCCANNFLWYAYMVILACKFFNT